MLQGNQCTGEAESFIERNPGNYDPVKISGLPTSNEVSSMFETGTSYDTPAFDRTADMSLRNILEGFANPNNGIRGKHFLLGKYWTRTEGKINKVI